MTSILLCTIFHMQCSFNLLSGHTRDPRFTVWLQPKEIKNVILPQKCFYNQIIFKCSLRHTTRGLKRTFGFLRMVA